MNKIKRTYRIWFLTTYSRLQRSLQGDDEISEKSILHMDLTEVEDGIPFVQAARHCTLEELADNTRRIICEVFKHYGLDGNGF